jgi:predicted histone-like DNA-binding protein
MTVNNIAFPVVAVQNQNDDSTAFGKWFLRALYPDTLSMKGLIERVAWDQSVYSRDIIEGVIKRVSLVMVEQLKAGQPVKWDGLGTFMPALDCKKQGVNRVADVSVDQINGVRINFIPENAQGEQLTSKKFKETITFNRVGWIEIQKVTPQDKKPYYQQILHPFKNVVQVAE